MIIYNTEHRRLKTILVFIFIFLVGASCTTSTHHGKKSEDIVVENGKIKTQQSLAYLWTYENKYPFDVHLFEDTLFTKRVKKLIGNHNYRYLVDHWDVETPITIDKGLFIVSGCKAHTCNETNFIIVIDPTKDIMNVGIRKNRAVSVYTEDGIYSSPVKKWAEND